MVNCKLLLFAKAKDLVGCGEKSITVTDEQIKVSHLESLIFEQIAPELSPIRNNCVLAVAQEYVAKDQVITLTENIEIAVIPPLSGG